MSVLVFFFNDTATTEIYTLSLHDALPISLGEVVVIDVADVCLVDPHPEGDRGHHHRPVRGSPPLLDRRPRLRLHPGVVGAGDRKSTRLNSSHSQISYAVFCLKKKNTTTLS